jgi:hypothetical protein
LSKASGRSGSGFTQHGAELLVESFNAASGINDLLFAGVERVTHGADFNVEGRFAHGGTRRESAAAGAGHLDFFVIRVDCVFHFYYLSLRDRRMWPIWKTQDYP